MSWPQDVLRAWTTLAENECIPIRAVVHPNPAMPDALAYCWPKLAEAARHRLEDESVMVVKEALKLLQVGA